MSKLIVSNLFLGVLQLVDIWQQFCLPRQMQMVAKPMSCKSGRRNPSNPLVQTLYASTVPWSTNSLLTSLFFFCQVNALTCLVLYASWLATSYLHVKYLRLFHLKSLKRELPTFISKERQLLNKATIDYYCVNT